MGLLRAGHDENAGSADRYPAPGATKVDATPGSTAQGNGWRAAGLLECEAGCQFTPPARALAQQVVIEQAGRNRNSKPSYPLDQCLARLVAG